jgi:hypothetical protein
VRPESQVAMVAIDFAWQKCRRWRQECSERLAVETSFWLGHRIVGSSVLTEVGPGALTGAAQSAMDALHDAFGNSQRDVAALETAFAVPPNDHAGLTREYSANGLFAQVPEAGQFSDGKMSLERRFAHLSRATVPPVGFRGGRFSCVHGESLSER